MLGFGRLDNTKPVRAHQVAYALANDSSLLPPGWVVHHECENKACCNPAHLSVISASEHMRMHNNLRVARKRGVLSITSKVLD